MQKMFEDVTKMALEEIVLTHSKETKFGLLLTPESYKSLVGRLHEFFLVSRSMKSQGDKLLGPGPEMKQSKRPFARG